MTQGKNDLKSMMLHFRAVLITGGAKRLGKYIALKLAKAGWDIALHYNYSHDEALQTANEIKSIGVRCDILKADLQSVADCTQLIQEAIKKLPNLCALVNNASAFIEDYPEQLDLKTWQFHMDVNLRAPWLLSQGLYQHLAQVHKKGCIVNILDQKVFNLNASFYSYTISKCALESATRLLALAYAPRLRVCGLAPGITLPSGDQTQADFLEAHRVTPLEKSSTTEDIANAVDYLVSAQAVTGTTLIVDGGQHLYPLKEDVMFAVRKKQNT